MIPKIICWLFGHKRREKSYTGNYSTNADILGRYAAYYIWKYWEQCPRCGKDLK